MVNEVRAETVGRAARGGDMQLTVPFRPAVRRGVRFRRTGDSVVLDGADRPQAFNGAFAREMLIPLVDSCDGTRGHRELADELGLAEEAVYKAVALLWAAGGVEEGPGEVGRDVRPEFATLLSRLGNSTGANRSWTQCLDRLRHRSVRLEGHGPSVAAAGRAFNGVCEVAQGPPGDGGAADGELVVFFEGGSSRLDSGPLADRCWREGIPLLRIRVDAEAVTVGPYVDPALTPCVECGTCQEDAYGPQPPEHVVELAAGVTAHHVTALLARATMTHLPLDTSRIDVADLSTTYNSAVSRPGCRKCSHSTGPMAAKAPDSAVYEASVAMPPRAFLDPKGHLGHYQTGNMSLTAEFRTWPSSPKVELPAPDLSRLAGESKPPEHGRPTTLDDLSLVLKIAFGVRELPTAEGGGRVRRWTAAAGNIGCTTAYVLCRDDGVLPAGVYAYVERDHVLARVSGQVPPGEDRIGLVIVGDLVKVMRKYGTFGLRLTMLDAGCNLAGVREVTEAIGSRVRLVPDWDDGELSRHLGTSPTNEPVVAVAALEAPREI